MTKEQFQKELVETVKEGIKSSDIKKLKKSKSADDISPTPPAPLLQEQLKEKQKEVKSLRGQLEAKNTELSQTKQELDNSLFARVEAVKQFGLLYDKLQLVRKELDENVEEASSELIDKDEKITKLRTKQRQAQARIRELEKDLNLTQRIVELRVNNLETKPSSFNWWIDYSPIILLFGFAALSYWLLKKNTE